MSEGWSQAEASELYVLAMELELAPPGGIYVLVSPSFYFRCRRMLAKLIWYNVNTGKLVRLNQLVHNYTQTPLTEEISQGDSINTSLIT